MSDISTCRHERTETVEVRDPLDGGAGPATVIGHVCVDCHERLPAAWGCDACEWTEIRRLCDPVPTRLLAQPCARHAET